MRHPSTLYAAASCGFAGATVLLLGACASMGVETAHQRAATLVSLYGAGAALIATMMAALRWAALTMIVPPASGRHRLREADVRTTVFRRAPLRSLAAAAAHHLAGLRASSDLRRCARVSDSPSEFRASEHGTDHQTPMEQGICFYWQWESTRPQPDPLMTRERASKLLRAWRRATSQGRRVFDLRCVRQRGTRAYLVQHQPSGERAGLYIQTGAVSAGSAEPPLLTMHHDGAIRGAVPCISTGEPR
jgi:hypothetical protein